VTPAIRNSTPKTVPPLTERIVSLAPSVTSILVALGARQHLVGVTKWCADVAEVSGLPRLGHCWSLDVKQVEKLRPTLVIGSVPYKQETVAKLLDSAMTFLAMNPRSLADIYSDIRLLGRITARASAAERLTRQIRKSLAAISARARRAEARPRVYCEAWSNPRITSPPWVEELVAIAGGRMVLPGGKRITDEAVVRANPEVIVIAWTATGIRSPASKALSNPKWQQVPAILHRRVHVVRDELLNTPGPPIVEGAKALFRILHPDLARQKNGRPNGD